MSGIYERQYEHGLTWEDEPVHDTPIDAEHLNKLDDGMKRVDAEVSAAMRYLYGRIKEKGWA